VIEMGVVATVLGAVASAMSIKNSIDASNAASKAAKGVLSYDQAMSQADQALSSLYDKNVTNTLNALDKSSASRGFYGQAAADALKGSRAAEIQGQKSSAIANLASQLQGQSASNAAQLISAATNSANSVTNQNLSQASATGNYSNPWTELTNLATQLGTLFKGNQSTATSGSIGGNLVMDQSGNITYAKPQYGLGNGYTYLDF
jgi:hypothetical protein